MNCEGSECRRTCAAAFAEENAGRPVRLNTHYCGIPMEVDHFVRGSWGNTVVIESAVVGAGWSGVARSEIRWYGGFTPKAPQTFWCAPPEYLDLVVKQPDLPADSWAWLKAGAVVRLRSGGPAMTARHLAVAHQVAAEQSWLCGWFNGAEYRESRFGAVTLMLANAEGDEEE